MLLTELGFLANEAAKMTLSNSPTVLDEKELARRVKTYKAAKCTATDRADRFLHVQPYSEKNFAAYLSKDNRKIYETDAANIFKGAVKYIPQTLLPQEPENWLFADAIKSFVDKKINAGSLSGMIKGWGGSLSYAPLRYAIANNIYSGKEAALAKLMDGNALTGKVLDEFVTPPTDAKKREDFLLGLRVLAGGKTVTVEGSGDNKLVKFALENDPANGGVPANEVSKHIDPYTALLVSAAHYRAAEQLLKPECTKDGGIEFNNPADQTKYAEYVAVAEKYERLARSAGNDLVAAEFYTGVDAFNKRKPEPKPLQKIYAHMFGDYGYRHTCKEDDPSCFTDETVTARWFKYNKTPVGAMMCFATDDDKENKKVVDPGMSYHFSSFAYDWVAATWWTAKSGALGCFGKTEIVGCPEGQEFVSGKCVPKCGDNQERINGECKDKCPTGTRRKKADEPASYKECIPEPCNYGRKPDGSCKGKTIITEPMSTFCKPWDAECFRKQNKGN